MTSPKLAVLREMSIGERVAEHEMTQLASYFVETEQWRQLVADEKDIVYGAKGSGKSALYSLLVQKQTELFDRGILIVAAEHPKGAPAFNDLAEDPPTTEPEFIGLWKLYFLSLVGKVLQDWGIDTPNAREVYRALSDANLLDISLSLQDRLRQVLKYVGRICRPEAFEAEVKLDLGTGVPVGLTGKIILGSSTVELRDAGFVSLSDLLTTADAALAELNFSVWVVLDRLDVAFTSHDDELERNALRALFSTYLDLQGLENIALKIFLRTDIWRTITERGFREASHVTRHLTITWERQALLQLILRRVLQNDAVCKYYTVDPDAIYADVGEQERLVHRMMPSQMGVGEHVAAFDWMLSRTRDGLGQSAPRELIHLVSSLRNTQIKRLEVGHADPPSEMLFEADAFEEALREVSEVRLAQTLFAEYPQFQPFVELLDGEKTRQTLQTLSGLWNLPWEDCRRLAGALVDVGFFEVSGLKSSPIYEVPYLYRPGLKMVQGDEQGFLHLGRQVIDRVAQRVMAQISSDLEPRLTAPNSGVGYEEVHLLFKERRYKTSLALWFFAAEARSPTSLHVNRRGPVIGVGLLEGISVELNKESWELRMTGAGFRWYKHIDGERAGYRIIVDARRFVSIAAEEEVPLLSDRVLHALARLRML